MSFGWFTWPLALVTVAALGYRLIKEWLGVLGARALGTRLMAEQHEEIRQLLTRVSRLEMQGD
jgi:hypothetical protein